MTNEDAFRFMVDAMKRTAQISIEFKNNVKIEATGQNVDFLVLEIPSTLMAAICKAVVLGASAAAVAGISGLPLQGADGEEFGEDDYKGVYECMWDSPDEARSELATALLLSGVISEAGYTHDGETLLADFSSELAALPTFDPEVDGGI